MPTSLSRETVEQAVAFHGHLCPGLTNGLRVAEIALRELGPRSPDEEIVAVVETDSCAVDAIQFLVGTTFGKGNLLFQDRGQNVFTFARRSDNKSIRVRARPRTPRPSDPAQEALQARVRAGQGSPEDQAAYDRALRERALAVLEADEADMFEVEHLEGYVIPDKAQLYPSEPCGVCGQPTMAPRLATFGGLKLCLGCLQRELAGGARLMRPIGVVHNDLDPRTAAPRARADVSRLALRAEYAQALLGIKEGSQLYVLFGFDRAPEKSPLSQHPRGEATTPERGVFALRSPHRPNPLGLTLVKVTQVEDTALVVAGLDAWDGSPLYDLKPYVPELDR